MAMIETNNLTKRFGDLTALDSVDLTVDRGSIHGFVGPNGAGKTTTMQLLTGLISPTAGSVRIANEPAGSMAANRRIGYSPQEPAFPDSMTGLAYLTYMGRVAGMDGARATERADKLTDWLSLADARDQQIGTYSGGMARRLSLAQAMIHEPDLLLLDEPTATLDPEGRRAIIESLQRLTDEGMTVFVSSHVLAELEQFVDAVSILIDGELVRSGSIAEIQSAFGDSTYTVDTSDNDALVRMVEQSPLVTDYRRNDDGTVTVRTNDADSFTAGLTEQLADAGIVMQSLEEEGGLEDTVAGLLQRDREGS
jgi:ABC-2 type transport system ATP-binding protein